MVLVDRDYDTRQERMMGLFDPAWMSKNEQRALKAVERAKNEDQLFEILNWAPLESVRIAAARRTENVDALVTMLLVTASDTMRAAVRERLQAIAPERLAEAERIKAEKAAAAARAAKPAKPKLKAKDALNDRDIDVCVDAIRRVGEDDFVEWLMHGKRAAPTGSNVLWERIDKLPEEKLEMLVGCPTVDSYVRRRACGKLGHLPGENCVCTRCGMKVEHTFDESNTCTRCGARLVEEVELLESQRITWARRTNRSIVYADGTREWLEPKLEHLVDEATLNWLFQD